MCLLLGLQGIGLKISFKLRPSPKMFRSPMLAKIFIWLSFLTHVLFNFFIFSGIVSFVVFRLIFYVLKQTGPDFHVSVYSWSYFIQNIRILEDVYRIFDAFKDINTTFHSAFFYTDFIQTLYIRIIRIIFVFCWIILA